MLVSRDSAEMVIWHWTAYKRFFHPYRYMPMSTYAQQSDMKDSRESS